MVAAAGLSGCCARDGTFDAVIQGVAKHVQQGLEEAFDNHLVGFRIVAFGDQVRGLAEAHDHLAHQPRKALEDIAHLQDANVQDGAL